MAVLEVKGLSKQYPEFLLDGISFSLEEGRIMGLIGRNGAGKTTTLKSIFNIVHKSGGEIKIFGFDMPGDEQKIKTLIGYTGGAINYYQRKKLKDIAAVTRRFYTNWDDDAYHRYSDAFSLNEEKTPLQLSEGMRVKFSLTLALSHNAKLLILDEPTSGLDPVSRAELLDTFTYLKGKGVSILFSTHITSDLEKCADDITYIAKGSLIASMPLERFLCENRAAGHGDTLEEIMVHYEKEDINEKLAD